MGGLHRAVWHIGTTGVGQTVEVASSSPFGEAYNGIGISMQWEGPWPWGLDTKGPGPGYTVDLLGDLVGLVPIATLSSFFDKWGH